MKRKFTWKEYNKAMKQLVNYTKKNNITNIIGIYRGSLVPAVHLSNLLNLPLSIIKFQSRDGIDKYPMMMHSAELNKFDNILIIDDIFDTGTTVNKVNEYLEDYNLYWFFFFASKNIKEFQENNINYIFENNDKWIEFPWEYLEN